MTEDPKGKIVQLMRAGTTPNRSPPKGHKIKVQGSGNIVAGGDVHVFQSAPKVPRPTVVTNPGVEHISTEQRAKLKALVDEIVETEARLKQRPRKHSSVWSALNKHCGAPSYSLIASGHFEKARTYLNSTLGRLNSMASAPVKNGDEWRSRKYKYIKINAKSPADSAALTAYIKTNFGADSLTELSNDELERAYRYVASRRPRR